MRRERATSPKTEKAAPVTGFRLGFISLLASFVGILAGLIAYLLYDLIGLFTNLAYYHEWSFHFRSPEHTHLGPWVIVTPVIGGLIIGFIWRNTARKKSKGMEFRKRWKRCWCRGAGLSRRLRF